ncbi:hypothetical protein GCM10010329_04480 [Streptomyces spiroverticillatus]|uniref:Lipoprotein n=1 Tax=Streptomyces finlayi TaxID=67296 RepID=A0A918WST0_9ACTN|nr:hypothetical protein [Streptomyces finlayi]GGZ87624.1 hypothetical protein GCM10010329_04480 [Streptomyces spiroverticillatus]GHC78790.1 hypothetical protein GCM10010334_04460 [Streptomyces finlayi]
MTTHRPPAPRRRARPATLGLTALACAALALSGCTATAEKDLTDSTDYDNHNPLRVVGFPSTGTLRTVQRVVWRLADGDPDGLAELAIKDDGAENESPEKTAQNWVDAFGEGARGKVTADFYGDGSYRTAVVLYFEKTKQIKQILVRVGSDDEWGVRLAEPDPAKVKENPSWVPRTPGATGSGADPQ